MLPQPVICLASFADQQHGHFRAVIPHRSMTGGQYDSSIVECIPGNLGPRALSSMRQRRSPMFWFKLNRFVSERQEVIMKMNLHGVCRWFIVE